jgi:hypothetical protein
MDYEYSQRRRTFIAIAITVVLGPAAFLLSRGPDDSQAAPQVTVIGTTPQERPSLASAPTATDVMGTSPPILEAPESDPTNDPATIAIPRVPRSITGTASFSRDLTSPTGCQVASLEVPFNARVTVTNLDNSQSIDCINNVGGTRPRDAVVLHADAFLEIADLTDAPVPVQITW